MCLTELRESLLRTHYVPSPVAGSGDTVESDGGNDPTQQMLGVSESMIQL